MIENFIQIKSLKLLLVWIFVYLSSQGDKLSYLKFSIVKTEKKNL